MHTKTIVAALAAGVLLAGSSTAAAQTQTSQSSTKFFIDVNGGGQTQSRTMETSTSFPLYGETAVINTAQGVDGGGLFDISVGYRVRPAFGVSLGVSIFGDTGESSVAASIPNPAFVNRPANVTASATGLEHNETATHLLFTYFYPVRDKIEAALSIGPSFFNVSQDFTTASIPTGTQNLTLGTHRERARTVGINVGASINYFVRPNYGAGVFFRYAGATAKFDTVDELKVGGVQLGGGLRLRF